MFLRSHLLGCLIALLLLTASPRVDAFSQLYIFGDSLSDTGNLASVRGDFPPPFFNNRVSNGPVGVEFLASSLGLSADPSLHLTAAAKGTNYAVAGARARGAEPIDLTAQVAAFLQNQSGAAPADALYVVFIGGNDVRDARDVDSAAARDILHQAIDAIATAIKTLAAAGATTFFVANAPDLGRVPETALLAQAMAKSRLVKIATLRSRMFNRKLARQVRRLKEELGLRIAEADLFQSTDLFLRNATAYGFENVTDPCFSQQARAFSPACENGARFDVFFFFDEIHPSARAHEQLGRALSAFAPSMLVPAMP